MFGILVLLGIAGFLSLTTKSYGSSIGEVEKPKAKALPPYREAKEPAGFAGPPMLPEEERLLSLLVLWSRDKKHPRGQKRYLTDEMARELLHLCVRLGLRGTARAVLTDGPIPAKEPMGRRGITVRHAVISFGSHGRLG